MNKILLCLILPCILIFFGCSKKNKTIAVFKDGSILQKELDFELLKYPEQGRPAILRSSLKIKDLLEDLAVKKIAYLTAKKTNLINLSEISNDTVNNKTVLVNYLLNKEIKPVEGKVKGSDIPKFTSSVKMKIIWVMSFPWMNQKEKDEAAQKVKMIKKLYNNGVDFSELANRYSDDPRNFRNGNTGVISNNFEPEALGRIRGLRVNESSDVIKLKKGYYIFKANYPVDHKLNVSYILIKTNNNGNERAKKIKELLNNGYDFTETANEYTEDESNFLNGVIPSFLVFKYPYYPVANTAYNTKEGKVSTLFDPMGGFFIIKTEKITKPDKNNITSLSKNERYLQMIKNMDMTRKQYRQQIDLTVKIADNCKIAFNFSLFTNKAAKSNDIAVEIPEINKKITYKECLPLINAVTGPKLSSASKFKANRIFEKLILNELAFHYAQKKKLSQQDEFKLSEYSKFYNEVFKKFTGTMNNKDEPSERELREFYTANEGAYYTTKIMDNKPAWVKLTFDEAKISVKKDYNDTKQKEAADEWKTKVLKTYAFKINYAALGLEKNAAYYIRSGDEYFLHKNYKKALKYYLKAVKTEKDYTEAYFKTMQAYGKLNDNSNLAKFGQELNKIENLDTHLLLKYLINSDKKFKIKLIQTAGIKGNRTIETNLISLYKNGKDIDVITPIISALGSLRSASAFPILFSDLKNFDQKYSVISNSKKESIKWIMVDALGNIGNKESTDYLIILLNSTTDLNLKVMIVEALGKIRDIKAVPILEKLLNDKKEIWGVQNMAAESLRKITGKNYETAKEVK